MDLLEKLNKMKVDKDEVNKIYENKEYNSLLACHYVDMAKKMENFESDEDLAPIYEWLRNKSKSDNIYNKSEYIDTCCNYWDINWYKKHFIKEVTKINLCHDKFCNNCKKVLQALRLHKYENELSKHGDKLYHMTLTVPNCNGLDLRDVNQKMRDKFKWLVDYLAGKRKIKGIDFSTWGYLGALRSFECTIPDDDEFHPHFHIGLILDCELSKKYIRNTFSYNHKGGRKEFKSAFCKEEIMVQKIWYLLINDIKVTKKNIDELEVGYSCKIDKFAEGEFMELFKYMTKGTTESGQAISYHQFTCLYYGLYRLPQIQGYGVLWHIEDDFSYDEVVDEYNKVIESLMALETPVNLIEGIEDVLLDKKNAYVSKRAYVKAFRNKSS